MWAGSQTSSGDDDADDDDDDDDVSGISTASAWILGTAAGLCVLAVLFKFAFDGYQGMKKSEAPPEDEKETEMPTQPVEAMNPMTAGVQGPEQEEEPGFV